MQPSQVADVWRPDVTVASLVERDGRFLFVEERVRGRLVLNQPAGHLEPDESLVAAVARETREETGWVVEPTALVGVYQWRNAADGATFLRFAFAAQPLHQVPGAVLDAGIERALWLSADELDAAAFEHRSPLVRLAVEHYLAGRRVPLEALHAIAADPG